MENKPLISVLMTSYNREKYIAEAIKSVLASSYKNFELIITDDRSKDNTVAIAKSFAENDDRIKIFINENNLGDYLNRNKAASLASGKYLKYVDADDYIYPWGLELLVKMMEAFPDAGWGLCSLEQNKERPFPFLLNPSETFKYHYFGPGLFHKAPLSSIIKKDAFDAAGGFTGKQHMGDFEMWHMLAMKNNVLLMPHGIVWYREHDDQQMSANRSNPFVNFKYKVGAYHFFSKRKDIPLSSADIDLILKYLNKSMNKLVMVKILKGNISTAFKLLKMKRSAFYTLGNKI